MFLFKFNRGVSVAEVAFGVLETFVVYIKRT